MDGLARRPCYCLISFKTVSTIFSQYRLAYIERSHFDYDGFTLWFMTPNTSPEPTAVGAVSSAIAVRVASRRWLSFLR
jgi:hypothetical protein